MTLIVQKYDPNLVHQNAIFLERSNICFDIQGCL
jgi:hypothetical protein